MSYNPNGESSTCYLGTEEADLTRNCPGGVLAAVLAACHSERMC